MNAKNNLSLRELIVERILFAIDEDDLIEQYGLTEDEVAELADVDLLELYEELYTFEG